MQPGARFVGLVAIGLSQVAAQQPLHAQPAPRASETPRGDDAGDGLARVHLRATVAARLLHRVPDGDWQVVCDLPCDYDVTPQDEFRIAGAPRAFRLAAGSGETITIDPPSPGGRALGLVIVSIGGVGFWAGAIVSISSAITSGLGCVNSVELAQGDAFHNEGNWPTCGSLDHRIVGGLATTGLGLALAGLGALIFTRSSSLDVVVGPPLASPSLPPPTPAWHEDTAPGTSRPSVRLTVPLVRVSF